MKRLVAVCIFALAVAFSAQAGSGGHLKGKVLKLDKNCRISEVGGSSMSLSLSGLNSSKSLSLLDVERALVKAADDSGIAMVYINFDHFSASVYALEEIRPLLRRISEAGKPVVAYGASLSNGSYYLASAADRIFLHPQGGGALTGLASTQYFLKDLLDTLGVEVQLIRHGKFKSAGEMYIRNDISPENRAQYEALMGSLWRTISEEVADARGLSASEIDEITDGLLTGTAQMWMERGLVDGLKYRDEMEKYICHLFGVQDPDEVETVSLPKYVEKLRKGPSSRKIAVVYADGEIVRSGSGIVGEKLAAEIAKVRADSTVKAVVFRVNSPGGEVVAADMIRREIELLRADKPVVASYGAYAASGGYLISAACDRIFVDNTTLTGSIGVFGMIPSLGSAIKKNLKVNVVSIGTNAHSAMGSGMNPLSAEEQAWYQDEIEGIYDDFLTVVAEGRDMEKEAVDEIAQGRVWAGRDALQIGLADEKGSLLDAIDYAASLVGLRSYRITAVPEKKNFLKSLREKEDRDEPLVSFDIPSFLSEPGFHALARMPYLVIE